MGVGSYHGRRARNARRMLLNVGSSAGAPALRGGRAWTYPLLHGALRGRRAWAWVLIMRLPARSAWRTRVGGRTLFSAGVCVRVCVCSSGVMEWCDQTTDGGPGVIKFLKLQATQTATAREPCGWTGRGLGLHDVKVNLPGGDGVQGLRQRLQQAPSKSRTFPWQDHLQPLAVSSLRDVCYKLQSLPSQGCSKNNPQHC